MIVKQVRVSQQAKDQLSRLKAKTGIKNWNILCRWALAYSLAEKTIPTDVPINNDSNGLPAVKAKCLTTGIVFNRKSLLF